MNLSRRPAAKIFFQIEIFFAYTGLFTLLAWLVTAAADWLSGSRLCTLNIVLGSGVVLASSFLFWIFVSDRRERARDRRLGKRRGLGRA